MVFTETELRTIVNGLNVAADEFNDQFALQAQEALKIARKITDAIG